MTCSVIDEASFRILMGKVSKTERCLSFDLTNR